MELEFEGKFTSVGKDSICAVVPKVGTRALGIKVGQPFKMTVTDDEIVIRWKKP